VVSARNINKINAYTILMMLEWLPVDLIVEIGILAGPDEYEELAKTSERNAIILQKPYIAQATNVLLIKYTFEDGVIEFRRHGKLHSFCDQPAMLMNGIDNWFLHMWFRYGKLHRDNDMPATLYSDGSQSWYQYGELHRDNDMPAQICSNGQQSWYQNGKRHRDNDLPAEIHIDGLKAWWVNGTLHRDHDNPAVIYGNGNVRYYRNGVCIVGSPSVKL
jgi:hypothetical protein